MVNTYSNKDYWNQRFEKTESFDWYVGWSELKNILTPIMDETSNILMVGCGNSKVSENIYIEGYCNITNIDISDVVIEKMKTNNVDKKNMKYIEMDATNMNFDKESFQVTIDKGTLDALNCSDNDSMSVDLIREMFRVTSVKGYCVIITHSGPDLRLPLIMKSLVLGSYELECQKIELSFMSNLINSIRSKKDKGSTMKEAISDKNVLISSLLEVCENKVSRRDSSKIQQLAKYLKIMKLINEKKAKKTEVSNDELTEEKVEEDKKSHNESKEDGNTLVNNEEQVKNANIVESSQPEESKHLRRDHCYCFIIRKIK